jgi:GMP synthase-like glutamine amidotransferase
MTRDRGDELTVLCHVRGLRDPPQSSLMPLIVLGGPMSVNDYLPWLVDEKELVRTTSVRTNPFTASAGAQMIAQVLGGTAKPMGYREIGFFPFDTASGCGPHHHLPRHTEKRIRVALAWGDILVRTRDDCAVRRL